MGVAVEEEVTVGVAVEEEVTVGVSVEGEVTVGVSVEEEVTVGVSVEEEAGLATAVGVLVSVAGLGWVKEKLTIGEGEGESVEKVELGGWWGVRRKTIDPVEVAVGVGDGVPSSALIVILNVPELLGV